MRSRAGRHSTSDQSPVDRASKPAKPRRRKRRKGAALRRPRPRLPSPARHLRHVDRVGVQLRSILPARLYIEMSPRQRARLALQAEIILAWKAYRQAVGVGSGRLCLSMSSFVEAVRPVWPGRISPRTLRRWLRTVATDSFAKLVDRRGRPRGRRRVDPRLWNQLRRLVSAGASVAAANRAVQPEAARRGLWWPVLRVVQIRMREERLQLVLNKHLLRDCTPN